MSLPRVGPEAFDGSELRRGGRVAVAFLADWCPFCRAFEPDFAELAKGLPGGYLVADLTAHETPLWERFAIETVPTVIVFQDGRAVLREDGTLGEGLDPVSLRRVAAAMRARAVSGAAPRPDRGGGPSRRRPRAPSRRRSRGGSRGGARSR